nr:uncharacterized protein LOC129433555 [Misgurnus anguillicaudatus]
MVLLHSLMRQRVYAGGKNVMQRRVRYAQLARIRPTSSPHPPGGFNAVVARLVGAAAPDQPRTRRTDCHSVCNRQVWRRVGADLYSECDCCVNLLIRKRIWHRCKCCLGTPEETRRLIHFRADNDVQNNGQTTMGELRTPKTGSGTDQGEVTVATWQYFGDMHEVLGARPAMDPPVVVASYQPGAEDPITILMDIVEPSTTSELSTTAASWTPDTGPSRMSTSTPAATSTTTSRRRSNPIMEFLTEEALQEKRRHEESEAKSQRFLDLFERKIEKM